MPETTLFKYYFRYFLSLRHTSFILYLCLLVNSPQVLAFHQDELYLLSPDMKTDLEIDTAGHQEITIAIDTKVLEQDLQGKIPVQLILDNDNVTFENGEQQLFWHNRILAVEQEKNKLINNDPFIYLKLNMDENFFEKKLKVRIRKEEDISKLSAMAAFFPQMLPIILMGEVTWGPKPVIFYDALMRWNYKVLESDIIKSTRELILSQSFGKNKPLLAQCSEDFIESFLLFEAANYGETSASLKTKTQTFRTYIMSAPFKRLMDCMSGTVSATLIDIQENQITDEWQYLKKMNRESINGLSKIMVGYGFNTFAFEAGDFFKSLKKTIGFPNATDELLLQTDLDRSLVTAAQYTLQSGYEDFFKGQLKYHNLNERYSMPLSVGAGVIEILWRLNAYQSMTGRDRTHQNHSFTKRAEAIGVSINKTLALTDLSDVQLLMLGVTIPAIIYGVFKVSTGYYSSEPVFNLFNAAYEGMVLGAVTHLISPVLQKYGIWAAQTIQKPIIEYMDSESGSWAEYFLADSIRYRIDIFTEN